MLEKQQTGDEAYLGYEALSSAQDYENRVQELNELVEYIQMREKAKEIEFNQQMAKNNELIEKANGRIVNQKVEQLALKRKLRVKAVFFNHLSRSIAIKKSLQVKANFLTCFVLRQNLAKLITAADEAVQFQRQLQLQDKIVNYLLKNLKSRKNTLRKCFNELKPKGPSERDRVKYRERNLYSQAYRENKPARFHSPKATRPNYQEIRHWSPNRFLI